MTLTIHNAVNVPFLKLKLRLKLKLKNHPIVNHLDKLVKIIDLFAGIGGIRLGFEEYGCEAVFSSEWDKHAQKMYEANFGEKPFGDINEIEPHDIPDHDILLVGFPCQPFSIEIELLSCPSRCRRTSLLVG